MPSTMIIQDGIIAWFDGPEWDEVAEGVFKDSEEKLSSKAKANAPWEDQTGEARAGLEAKASNDDGLISLYLYHTVDYGLWLEVIQNGRFATILPTLEEEATGIFREAGQAIARARQGHNF